MSKYILKSIYQQKSRRLIWDGGSTCFMYSLSNVVSAMGTGVFLVSDKMGPAGLVEGIWTGKDGNPSQGTHPGGTPRQRNTSSPKKGSSLRCEGTGRQGFYCTPGTTAVAICCAALLPHHQARGRFTLPVKTSSLRPYGGNVERTSGVA